MIAVYPQLLNASPRRRQRPVGRHWCLPFVVAIAIGLSWCPAGQALIVGNVPGVVPDTTVNPAAYSGWTQGDPGWNSVAINRNAAYLGDGWVLTARHIGNPSSVEFQTPTGPQTFQRIPGSYYQDYGYFAGPHVAAVSNPTTIPGLTEFTDLQLFRINGDPGVTALTIAETSPPLNGEVVMITRGVRRQAPATQWNATANGTDPDGTPHWDWVEAPVTGTYDGFKTWGNNSITKRWGTNHLANPNEYTSSFDQLLSSTSGVIKLTNRNEDVVALVTSYDKASPNLLEAQAVPGNSGGAVFHNRGTTAVPLWELVGILNATLVYEDQNPLWGIDTNATVFADLSYYYNADPAEDYTNSISHIMRTHADYSAIGDVNLDGVVSGDGTGAVGSDDVAAFVAGWGYQDPHGIGSINSWKNGDLNRDGKTDVGDFLMLRGALNGSVPSAVVATLFGDPSFDFDGAIPEPTTVLLASMAAACFALAARRRRPVS